MDRFGFDLNRTSESGEYNENLAFDFESGENPYNELQPIYTSSFYGSTNTEPIYMDLDLSPVLPPPTSAAQFSKDYAGRLEIQKSNGSLFDNNDNLYDRLVRKINDKDSYGKLWMSQTTLCQSCLKIDPNSVLGEQHGQVQCYGFPPSTNCFNKFEFALPMEDNELSEKFLRLIQQRSVWTSAETIFLTFYSEGMDKLYPIRNEEECNKVIMYGLGAGPIPTDQQLPKLLRNQFKKLKATIFQVCGFSVYMGVIPIVLEKRKKRNGKEALMFSKLKLLFKLKMKESTLANAAVVFMDLDGKIYTDMNDWEKNNKLSFCTILFPKNGQLTVDMDGEPDIMIRDSSGSRRVASYALQVFDVAVGISAVSAIGIGALCIAVLGFPVILPALVAGESAALAYSGIRGIMIYRDKRKRKRSCGKTL